MPIECRFDVCPADQQSFYGIDHQVMRHVFDVHNLFGRFCDEKIYQKALVERCALIMQSVLEQAEVLVTHQSFIKTYYLDMVVNNGVVYELKVADALAGRHQKQLINYLLLAGIPHGKLINFRPGSVEHRFVSSSLTAVERRNWTLVDEGWSGTGATSRNFLMLLKDILSDWGTHLDIDLYREALLCLLGGPPAGLGSVPIMDQGRIIGQQKLCLLDEQAGWHISAVRNHVRGYASHLEKMFMLTNLSRFHWINMNGGAITIKTLRKSF
ncbi:MAG TPA: GxxExxY protein [Kiritimatiellia bacterium]|nr:GxxExxY protein [Kiritimatiellia bacterium]HMP34711.1 GxxExxY protein [Kiritimatiellia bacterium]